MNKLTERGPSSEGVPSMHASSLNKSPDPHSIVERLRFDATRCEIQFSKGVAANIDEAATIISDLQAERDKLHTAITRIHNREWADGDKDAGSRNAAEMWRIADDVLGGCRPLQLKKVYIKPLRTIVEIDARYADQVRDLLNASNHADAISKLESLVSESEAQRYKTCGDLLNRALAAESSLSRIQSETVERCAKIAEEHTWTLPLYAPEENINVAVGEAANIVIGQVASAIRSSLTDVGEAKTAESLDSPSTQNTETE